MHGPTRLALAARVLAAAALTSLSTACGSGSDLPEPTQFVGAVAQSDVVLGAAESGGVVTFYVCGGPSTFATASRWFAGRLDGSGRVSLRTDGWHLAGELGLDGGEGTLVDPEGVTVTWSLQPTREGTAEGLYATTDDGCRTGVVVTRGASADEPHVQGTWCDTAGYFQQVTPILPIDPDARAVEVEVDLSQLGRGTRSLVASFVAP